MFQISDPALIFTLLSLGLIFLFFALIVKKEISEKRQKEKDRADYLEKKAALEKESRRLNQERMVFFNSYKLPKYILDRFVKDYPKYFEEIKSKEKLNVLVQAILNRNAMITNNIENRSNQDNANDLSIEEKLQLIETALMDYFSIFLDSNNKAFYNFPSIVADDLWHTFLLFTVDYREFCLKSFGKVIDHEPHTDKEPQKAHFTNLLNTFIVLKNKNNGLAFKLDSMFGVSNEYDYDNMIEINNQYRSYKELKSRSRSNQYKSDFENINTSLLLTVGLIAFSDYEEITDFTSSSANNIYEYSNLGSNDNATRSDTGSSSSSKSSYCGSTGGTSSCGSSSSSSSSSCGSSSCGGGCGGGG